MSESPAGHMTPDAFRRYGAMAVEWIARYMEEVERYPVSPRVEPGKVFASLPEQPPEAGEPFDQMLADVNEKVMPGIMHWQSPQFFGYFPANTSGPSILGELLSAGLGVQGMLWSTSPACTEVEMRMLDWMIDLLGLPDAFRSTGAGGGVIQDTASSSTLCALLAARERATSFASNERGIGDDSLTVYTSREAHSSVEKAVKIAGLGRDNLRLVDVDDRFAMKPEALRAMIDADVAAGRQPCFISATVGTTSSHGMDPLPAIADIAADCGAWLHVDAAHAGIAALCDEFRWIHDGLDRADSYCVNPHKWMFTNFDCDCFYVRERAALIQTLAILPEYLKNAPTQSGAVVDYRDWHIPLGRRFRALKLWFVIRHYGATGLRALVRHHVDLAQMFAGWVRESHQFTLAVDPPLSLVCFAHVAGDAATKQVMDTVNATGEMFITHTKLNDRFTLRFSIGHTQVEQRHIERAWALLGEAADQIS